MGPASEDIALEHLTGDGGEGRRRFPQVQAAGLGDRLRPVLRDRRTQGVYHRAYHRRDRVAVPAVVHRTQHRVPEVAAGDHQHAQGDREFLDRLRAGGATGVQGGRAVVGADRPVVRRDGLPQRAERRLEVRVVGGPLRRPSRWRCGCRPSPGRGRRPPRSPGRARDAGRGHRRREDTGCLAAVRRLVGARDVEGLGVSARRIGRVDQADRGHVHRGTAVDDVADACLAGVDVPVVQTGREPLLREEDALERDGLRLQLRDPARVLHQVRDEVVGHGVRVQVVADGRVDPYQRVGHQGVVGDVAVALVVRRDGAGGAPGVAVPGADDAVDATGVTFEDLVGE